MAPLNKNQSDSIHDFGQFLRMLRSRSKLLTLQKFASDCGVSTQAASNWEKGGAVPTTDNLRNIIEILFQNNIFDPGNEKLEINALWELAQSKNLYIGALDQKWLDRLLNNKPQKIEIPPLKLDAKLEEVIRVYLENCFEEDRKSEEIGQEETESPELQKVYIDLDIDLYSQQPDEEFINQAENLDNLMAQSRELKELIRNLVNENKEANRIVIANAERRLSEIQDQVDKVPKKSRPLRNFFAHEKNTANISSLDLLAGVKLWDRVLIIAGPGQGKSTLTQQLAQIYRASILEKVWIGVEKVTDDYLPFRIILKHLAKGLNENNDLNLAEYIRADINKRTMGAHDLSVKDIFDIFASRNSILIFDGLDEIGDLSLRSNVLKIINQFLNQLKNSTRLTKLKVIVTSRPSNELQSPHLSTFEKLKLNLLRRELALDYAQKWLKVQIRNVDKRNLFLEDFEDALDNKEINNLLITPLQVLIVLRLILQKVKPQTARESLFQKYWDVIVERELNKAITKNSVLIKSNKEELFNLHCYLGYFLHQRSAKQNIDAKMSEDEFEEETYKFLRSYDSQLPGNDLRRKVRQLAQETGDRIVIISKPEIGTFGFQIRSFQEFFASAYLVLKGGDYNDMRNTFTILAKYEHWLNVVLFAAARIQTQSPRNAREIILRVCKDLDIQPVNKYLKPGAWLALKIASDGAFRSTPDLQRDTILYGLEIFKTGLTNDQLSAILNLLQVIPENEQTIICNQMEDLLRAIAPTYLEPLLWLYCQLFPLNNLYTEKVEFLLGLAREDKLLYRLFIRLVLIQKAPISWIAKLANRYWTVWVNKFVEIWRSDTSPELLGLIFQEMHLNLDKVKELISSLGKSQSDLISLSDLSNQKKLSPEETFQISKPIDQFFLTLNYLGWLYHPYKGGSDITTEGYIGIGIAFANCSCQTDEKLLSVIPWLNSPMILPELKAIMWGIYWNIEKPNHENIRKWLVDVTSFSSASTNIHHFWQYSTSVQPWFLLKVVFERIISRIELPEQIYEVLQGDKQSEILQIIKDSFTIALDSQIDNQEIALVFSLWGLGIELISPDILNLERETGFRLYEIIPKSIIGLTRSIQKITDPPSQKLEIFLTRILAHLKQHNLRIQYPQLLVSMLELFGNGYPLLMLLLKHLIWEDENLAKSDYSQQAISMVIGNYLNEANCESKEIEKIFYHIGKFNINLDLQARINLSQISIEKKEILIYSLKSDNEFEKKGALKWWANEITPRDETPFSTGSRYVQFGSIMENQLNWAFKNLGIDLEYCLKLLEDADQEIRIAGINLLAAIDFPLESPEYRELIFMGLRNLSKIREHEAWLQYIYMAVVNDQNSQPWQAFLESLLNAAQEYDSSVINIAMIRYSALNSVREATFSDIDEQIMGLSLKK